MVPAAGAFDGPCGGQEMCSLKPGLGNVAFEVKSGAEKPNHAWLKILKWSYVGSMLGPWAQAA